MSFEQEFPELKDKVHQSDGDDWVLYPSDIMKFCKSNQRVREAIKRQYQSTEECEGEDWTDEEAVARGVCKAIEKELGL